VSEHQDESQFLPGKGQAPGCKKVGYRWEKVARVGEVTDTNFESEVLKSDLPVLVDFRAPWCGPCHMVAPVVHEVAEETQGRAKACKCNVDQANSTAAAYGIMSIPTLLVFKSGRVVEQMVGVVPKEQLISKINEHAEPADAG
jgi:thioredoxin 1